MSKKVTISVPDDLYAKMEKWRGKYNYSRIFQEAVSQVIHKQEEFQERLKGGQDMEQIIERLKREKVESGQNYYERGKNDGLEWARAASFDELHWAIRHETTSRLKKDQMLIACDPTQDEVIGDYFADVIADDPNLGLVETRRGYFMPNHFFIEWEKGWHEGVKEFWEEIKDKI